jgi:hypothetical protein
MGGSRLLPHHARHHRRATQCRGPPIPRLPRWSAPLALLAGLAFIADGITVGTDGFTGGVPNLVAWAAFIFFAVIATIAAWWHGRSDRPTEPQPAQDRVSRT